MLRKGIWNVAEDGLGAVHSEHNLIFMPQMRRKYSDSIVTIKVGGTGYVPVTIHSEPNYSVRC